MRPVALVEKFSIMRTTLRTGIFNRRKLRRAQFLPILGALADIPHSANGYDLL